MAACWRSAGATRGIGLKIAIASSGLGHIRRGVETWADDLATALVRAGHDVTLFQGAPAQVAPGNDPEPWRQAIPCWRRKERSAQRAVKLGRGMGGWRFGFGNEYDAEQTTFALSLWQRVGRRFDVVHVQDPLLARILDWLNGKGLSRPRVILAHGTEEPPEALARYQFLQHLTPVYDREWQARRPAGQYSTGIPNFIDVVQFSPGTAAEQRAARAQWRLPEDGLVVLCVAALKKKHKRCDYVIGEFARFAQGHPGARLVMAGATETETPEILGLASALGEKARILQDVPREQLPSLYRAADAFAFGSLHEAFGIVLLEAMACGLPVVCHDMPTLAWIAGDGGRPADLTKEGAMAEQLEALSDAGLRTRIAENARRRAEECFSADAVAGQILRMYEEVLRWPVGKTAKSLHPAELHHELEQDQHS